MSSARRLGESLKLASLLILGILPVFALSVIVFVAAGSLLDLALEPGDPCSDLVPFLLFFVPFLFYTRFVRNLARKHNSAM